MKYNLKVIISIGVLIVGIAFYFLVFKISDQIHYITIPVSKGNISQEVSADACDAKSGCRFICQT